MGVASALSACSHMITAKLRGTVTSQGQVKGNRNTHRIANRQDCAKCSV
jgi:hypothetical protein